MSIKNNRKKQKKNNLLDVSESLTDNSASINKIMTNDSHQTKNPVPAYLSQFDVQTFDSVGNPSAINDIYQSNDKNRLADLERQLSYNGSWSKFDENGSSMAYGVVPENELRHNNMIPYYNVRNGYGTNDTKTDSVKNLKRELFTGNPSNWKQKTENAPLFAPTADLEHIYGTPVAPEEQRERFMISRYHQNTKPVADVKVTPGLNLDYNDVGTHGFQPTYRPPEKTVDDLRVKPKITYEGRVIDGMKGTARPIQAPVITYKAPTFKEQSAQDMLPTGDLNTGPRTVDNFVMKDTNRQDQHFEYTGGAFTTAEAVGKNVPEHMREKYKESTKSTFVLPKPLQKFSKVEAIHNPNLQSYDLPFNSRTQTSENNHVSNLGGQTVSYANITDDARSTLKQITSTQPNTHATITPNTMRGTVHHMDIANPTLREISAENSLNPHAVSKETMHRTYNNDIAKSTVKELSIDSIEPANTVQNINIYANLSDPAKTTLHETTLDVARPTFTVPVGQYQRPTNIGDALKTTLHETTMQQHRPTMITPTNIQNTTHLMDTPRETIKSTTVDIPKNNFMTPVGQYQRSSNYIIPLPTTSKETQIYTPSNQIVTPINIQAAVTPTDQLRTTLHETTMDIPRGLMINPINKQNSTSYTDDAKTTSKQITATTPRNMFISNTIQNGQITPSDAPKTTLHETTMEIARPNIVTPHNIQGKTNLMDDARQTLKSTTIEMPRNNFISLTSASQKIIPTDIAKSTTKESTIQVPYPTFTTAVGQQQGYTTPSDVAKRTNRESLVETPQSTIVTGIAQQQGKSGSFNGVPLRTTNRESLVEIPYNTITTGVTEQRGRQALMDPVRTTLKEGLVENSTNGVVTAVGQQQRANNQNDTAKPTIRETTVHIPYNTNVTAHSSIAGKAYTFDKTPLKTTGRETIAENEHVGMPAMDVTGKGYGYMSQNMTAPNTNKQFTCQETYLAPIQGAIAIRPYDAEYNAEIDDRKELLHWYRTPTTSNYNKGPDAEAVNIQLKDDFNPTHSINLGYTPNNNLNRLHQQTTNKTNKESERIRYIDPKLIQQLSTNPYHQSILSGI